MDEDMKLLVTGSEGLVGSACVKLFTERGWEVIGIDNNMRARMFGTPTKEPMVRLDIRDEGAVNELFVKHSFDAIIHAAAQPSHDWSATQPLVDFEINARGTLILLEAARTYCPDAVFVFVSTDKVYGENMDGVKLSDERLGLDFAGRRSPFGCSKAAADMYVQEYRNYFGMKTVCFRPGCITGKAHEGAEYHGFLAYLVKCVKDEKEYHIFGDGINVRDQIHALDLANAFYYYIEHPMRDVYNFGGGPERSVSVLEALSIAQQKTGKRAQFDFMPARRGDRLYDVHDVTKFRNDYPAWDYQFSLDDIFNELCEK